MNKFASKKLTILFCYNYLWDDYKKLLRTPKKNKDNLYYIRKDIFEKHFITLQDIIKKDFKLKANFKPFKKEEEKE